LRFGLRHRTANHCTLRPHALFRAGQETGTTVDRKKQGDALLPGQPSDEIVEGLLLLFSRGNLSPRNPAGTFAGTPASKAVSIVSRGASAQAPHQSASLIWLHPSLAPWAPARFGRVDLSYSGRTTSATRTSWRKRRQIPFMNATPLRGAGPERRYLGPPRRRFWPSRLKMAFRRFAELSGAGRREDAGRSDAPRGFAHWSRKSGCSSWGAQPGPTAG
jgi:hypothetical protein